MSQQMAHGCKGCWGGDGGARAVWRVSRDPCITLASRCFNSVVTQDICRSRSPEDRTIFRGSNLDRVTKVGSSFTQKKAHVTEEIETDDSMHNGVQFLKHRENPGKRSSNCQLKQGS